MVIGPLTAAEEEKWEKAEYARKKQPVEFVYAGWADDDYKGFADTLLDQGHSYTETRLPRGPYVTPAHVVHFLQEFQRRAQEQGRTLVAERFLGAPRVAHKLRVKQESWWRTFGMVI